MPLNQAILDYAANLYQDNKVLHLIHLSRA